MALSKYIHTIRYLTATQIYHQVKYRLFKPKILSYYLSSKQPQTTPLKFTMSPPIIRIWDGDLEFDILNQKKKFEKNIEWSYSENGKLWNYNLQYCNYILQEDISNELKSSIIQSLYKSLKEGDIPLEPYPSSLRIINLIRWLNDCPKNLRDELTPYVHAETLFLKNRLEYHLLGNHLLENAFSLILSGAFFQNKNLVIEAEKILEKQLDEQILEDGAHFELSPMYHNIILFRVLELLDWYSKWKGKNANFEIFIRGKASAMINWLKQIRFRNGDIPHFNDSADQIAYPTQWLMDYAHLLGIPPNSIFLGESGYRSFHNNLYEIKIDMAQIGPYYQPGHAHADALSFILYYKNEPLFVEQGTSTYQISKRRQLERSTEAHNTVVVNNKNQSDVWGGFRVGRRAKTTIFLDNHNTFEARHDGYLRFGTFHRRKFECKDNSVQIQDTLSSDKEGVCYYHLVPGKKYSKLDHERYQIGDNILLKLRGSSFTEIETYTFARTFNQYQTGERLKITFKGTLTTVIEFKE